MTLSYSLDVHHTGHSLVATLWLILCTASTAGLVLSAQLGEGYKLLWVAIIIATSHQSSCYGVCSHDMYYYMYTRIVTYMYVHM